MTAMLSQDSPARFQLADASTWPNPWSMYRALRDHDPVHHVVPENRPEDDYFVLSRHADIWAAARDHETFSSAKGLTVNYGELDLFRLEPGTPLPPDLGDGVSLLAIGDPFSFDADALLASVPGGTFVY